VPGRPGDFFGNRKTWLERQKTAFLATATFARASLAALQPFFPFTPRGARAHLSRMPTAIHPPENPANINVPGKSDLIING
jgi:hypothetical protein